MDQLKVYDNVGAVTVCRDCRYAIVSKYSDCSCFCGETVCWYLLGPSLISSIIGIHTTNL